MSEAAPNITSANAASAAPAHSVLRGAGSSNPLISIIVPVYNVEQYLEQCVATLLAQTYANLEIILIDDGATDSSGALCDSLQKTDARIKVIHTENQGLTAARNEGLKLATGEIVMLVDSDDWIELTACENVKDVFVKENPDIYTFGFVCSPAELTPLGMAQEMRPANKIYNGFEPSLLFKDKARPYVWRSAFSREFLEANQLQFATGITLGEDQVFYFRAYPRSKKTVLSDKQLYVYRMREASMTHADAKDRGADELKTEHHLRVIEQILDDWKAAGLEDLCPSELEEWMLDFVLFDIKLLDREKRFANFKRLMSSFREFFGKEPSAVALHSATRACLQDIERTLRVAETNPTTLPEEYVRTLNFVRFYVMRYGLKRCFQQLLIAAGILKKWK